MKLISALRSSKKILIFDFSAEIRLFCFIIQFMPVHLSKFLYNIQKILFYEKTQF